MAGEGNNAPEGVQVYPISELTEKVNSWIGNNVRVCSARFEQKRHAVYLRRYLADLGARLFILESEYVDGHFLDDFASHYVSCFGPYRRNCARVHFFTGEWTPTTHSDSLSLLRSWHHDLEAGTTLGNLLGEYLGFVVIRPLPETMLGRTCLRIPASSDRASSFFISRSYEAHLFGITFKVESLAFEEQDRTVAACATVALWSTFHKTRKIFRHQVLTPAGITKAATRLYALESQHDKLSPGLTAQQMSDAIRSVNLIPLKTSLHDARTLKAIIYAYGRGFEIPAVLCMVVGEKKENGNDVPWQETGRHAVTVVGWALKAQTAQEEGAITRDEYTAPKDQRPESDHEKKRGYHVVSDRIEALFVHDDNAGPYIAMNIVENKLKIKSKDGQTLEGLSLEIERWPDEKNETLDETDRASGGNDSCVTKIGTSNPYEGKALFPELLITPIYHKMRIPFKVVDRTTSEFNARWNRLAHGLKHRPDLRKSTYCDEAFPTDLEWDIYLVEGHKLKTDLLEASGLDPETRKELLLSHFSKHMWRSIGRHGGNRYIELLFDATEIEQGQFFVRPIIYQILKDSCPYARRLIKDSLAENPKPKEKYVTRIAAGFEPKAQGDERHEQEGQAEASTQAIAEPIQESDPATEPVAAQPRQQGGRSIEKLETDPEVDRTVEKGTSSTYWGSDE